MTEQQAVERLKRNGHKFENDSVMKIILIKGNAGLKIWSAVDCLINYFGYWGWKRI